MEWFKNKDVGVYFDIIPDIKIRYITPLMNNDEKESVKKFPFINNQDLYVHIFDYRNNVKYDFVIQKGYCFDGASIPKLFWRVIGPNTDNKFLVAAMVHDFMCQNHSVVGNNRYLSTLVFNNMLEVGGVNPFKRWIMKHSVDNFQKFCGWAK